MRRSVISPWLWLLPAGALLIPFFLMPLCIVIRNSVYSDDPNGFLVADFTAANYLKVMTDAYYLRVFGNTLLIATLVTCSSLVIAYPFAQYLLSVSVRARRLLLWCVYIPLYVSIIMRAFGWTIILADSGIINTVLLACGIIGHPVRMLFEVDGMALSMLHRYLPLMIIPLLSALQKVEPGLLRASESLGASRWLTWRRVTLPISLPGMVAGTQLVFAGIMSDYALPSLLGSTKFQLMAPAIYYEAVTNSSWALGGAMATLLLAVVALFLVVMNLTLKRFAPWAPGL